MIDFYWMKVHPKLVCGAGRFNGWALLGAALALLLAACAAPPAELGRVESRSVAYAVPVPMAPSPIARFACGGALEDATWALWEQSGLPFLRQQLVVARLQVQGDTYALYDIQGYFHNLASLAQRCERPVRIQQIANALMPIFDKLEPLPKNAMQFAWVCHGGRICNPHNKLINTEVMLVSAQGLGLMSSLAQAMAQSNVPGVRNHPFVAATAQATAEHLLRWGDTKTRADWKRLAQAKASEVKNGSSALFFTDKPLWMIALYANLAGMYAQQPALVEPLTDNQRRALGEALRDALLFFKARTTLQTSSKASFKGAPRADIDQGFSSLYADNRYAGYTGDAPPAVCTQQSDGSRKAQLMVDVNDVPKVSGLGWDFSHARRLVHVLAALDQNRQAVQKVFGLKADDLPAPGLAKAFAAQLIEKIWNGDSHYPLFSNYWNGANGWYRVAYNNGTGYCNTGYPPFGLSDAFINGGYVTWEKYDPLIGKLGQTIYSKAENGSETEKEFIQKYYGGLISASINNRMLAQLMFWPTLIQ